MYTLRYYAVVKTVPFVFPTQAVVMPRCSVADAPLAAYTRPSTPSRVFRRILLQEEKLAEELHALEQDLARLESNESNPDKKIKAVVSLTAVVGCVTEGDATRSFQPKLIHKCYTVRAASLTSRTDIVVVYCRYRDFAERAVCGGRDRVWLE